MLSASQVVGRVWPHLTSDSPASDDPESGVVDQRPVPYGGVVGAHLLESMAATGIEVFGDDWPAVRAELADYIATMDVHRALSRLSRGRTTTINLKSVPGATVVISAHIDSLRRAQSPATSEFYLGGIHIHNAGVSSASGQSGQTYVQTQLEQSLADIPFVPAALTNYFREHLSDYVADASASCLAVQTSAGAPKHETPAPRTQIRVATFG